MVFILCGPNCWSRPVRYIIAWNLIDRSSRLIPKRRKGNTIATQTYVPNTDWTISVVNSEENFS